MHYPERKKNPDFFSRISPLELCNSLLDIQVLGGREEKVNTNKAMLRDVLFSTNISIAPKDSQAKAVSLSCSALNRDMKITAAPQRVYYEAKCQTKGESKFKLQLFKSSPVPFYLF